MSGTDERRAALRRVDSPFGRIPFFVTHLNWKFDEGHVREAQVREIVLASRRPRPPGGLPRHPRRRLQRRAGGRRDPLPARPHVARRLEARLLPGRLRPRGGRLARLHLLAPQPFAAPLASRTAASTTSSSAVATSATAASRSRRGSASTRPSRGPSPATTSASSRNFGPSEALPGISRPPPVYGGGCRGRHGVTGRYDAPRLGGNDGKIQRSCHSAPP